MSSNSTQTPSAAQQHAMNIAEKQGQAIVIWTIGMFCIFGWEWLICLPMEVNRIWKKKFMHISLLYLVNRYYGLVQFAMVISLLTNAFAVDECSRIFRWQPVGAMLSTLISQLIMGSRVYTIYAMSPFIFAIIGPVFAAEIAVDIYTLTVVFPAPSSAPGQPIPCIAIGPTHWLIAFLALPLVYDSLTFTLTLAKVLKYVRMEVATPTLSVLFRDGLVYFAIIFSMNLLNVVLFTTMPPALQAINLPATLMLNIIMSCRLILNVRAPIEGLANQASGSDHRFASAPQSFGIPLHQTHVMRPPPRPSMSKTSSVAEAQSAVIVIPRQDIDSRPLNK